MTRHWITWIGLACILAGLGAAGLAEVISQKEERKPSLAERLAALRRSAASDTDEWEASDIGPDEQSGYGNRQSRSQIGSKPILHPKGTASADSAAARSSRPPAKSSFFPSLDPLKLLPFHASRESTSEPPRQPYPSGSSDISSKSQQASVQNRRTGLLPSGRLGESLGDFRDLAKPVAEPPELTGESPIIAARGSRNRVVGEPVIVENDASETMEVRREVSEPYVSSRSRHEVDEKPSNQNLVEVNTTGRRMPLQVEPTERSGNAYGGTGSEMLRSSATPTSDPATLSSEPEARSPGSQDASEPAPYMSARRRKPMALDSVRSIPVESEGVVEEPPKDREQSRVPVLFNQSMPAISTQVLGPREIVIGQKATYRLVLRNDSHADSAGIQVVIRIPDSAEVVTSEASNGFTQRSSEGGLEWQIQQLSDSQTATLDMDVIPRSSTPLAIGVALRIAPLVQQTTVTVQEPKIEIGLQGPDDVLFGEAKVYRLQVTNPGTGPARNVVLHLIPPGGGDAQQSNHVLGILPAGKTETFEVELVPRDAGQLQVRASASADGGLIARCEKDVFVRQPKLSIEAQGLNETYAGTTAKYLFLVRNDGTADAKDVSVIVQLPKRAELVDAGDGYRHDTESQSVIWDVGAIPAGKEFSVALQCLVHEQGTNDVVAVAQTADKGLYVQAAHRTNVIALADLHLQISDPTGPVAVGDEAAYEITVRNRGSNSAKNVQVIALFSEGIDPVRVEGGQHTIRNGRVAFQPIENLAPGRDVTFKIRAVASTDGNHIFRAEVLCSELETKLSSEETTRYFVADIVPDRHQATAELPKNTSSR